MSENIFINDPNTITDEFIDGIISGHSGLIRLSLHCVVLRGDLQNIESKIALLSGGGAGHEPAHIGFIGKGMLTGAISGSVFTSPPPSSIFAAIKAVHSYHPSGILLIVTNYTGDRLNFGLAKEWALSQNINIDMIVVGEDCAMDSPDRSAGRRGLAGTVLVHKIAGALAERGESLEQIVSVIIKVCKNLGTIGACFKPCILPGAKTASFELGESEFELGLGIHGEAGIRRLKMKPCRQIVKIMIDHMTNSHSSTSLNLSRKDDVIVLLNNLGGTSNLEMGIFMNDALRYLHEIGVNVMRIFSGTYMTSLQMAGVSISIMKIPKSEQKLNLISLLDMKTDVLSPLISIKMMTSVASSDLLDQLKDETMKPIFIDQTTLSETEAETLKRCIYDSCHALLKAEKLLNEFDTGSGDGDCGSTNARGAEAVLKRIEENESVLQRPGAAFQEIATVCSEQMGGTSGALYSIFMTAAARHLANFGISDIGAAFEKGLENVQNYGGAKVGDRTMVDVLEPISKLLKNWKTANKSDLMSNLIETANESLQSTLTMKAQAGRASYVNNSLLTHPDAGAKAIAIIIVAIAKACRKN